MMKALFRAPKVNSKKALVAAFQNVYYGHVHEASRASDKNLIYFNSQVLLERALCVYYIVAKTKLGGWKKRFGNQNREVGI
jgi:hypothetical protein